jgi:hypothetical protein
MPNAEPAPLALDITTTDRNGSMMLSIDEGARTTGPPITASRVVAVLLADGWHHITPGSFSVGQLDFGTDDVRGGLGYRFEKAEPGNPYGPATYAGPFGAVLALRQIASARRPEVAHSQRMKDHEQ